MNLYIKISRYYERKLYLEKNKKERERERERQRQRDRDKDREREKETVYLLQSVMSDAV